MSWFGFDFNGNGKVGFGEHMLTMDMIGFFDDDSKAQDQQRSLEREAERDELHSNIEALKDCRSDLENTLFDLELNEPDISSPAYDAWETRRDALQNQIDDMDSEIFDLDCSLRDLDSW